MSPVGALELTMIMTAVNAVVCMTRAPKYAVNNIGHVRGSTGMVMPRGTFKKFMAKKVNRRLVRRMKRGATAALPCPEGSYSSASGLASSAQCRACPGRVGRSCTGNG